MERYQRDNRDGAGPLIAISRFHSGMPRTHYIRRLDTPELAALMKYCGIPGDSEEARKHLATDSYANWPIDLKSAYWLHRTVESNWCDY